MKEDRFDAELEEVIRTSMKMTDVPPPELNQKLKRTLYQQEASLQRQPAAHRISLWYLPMTLNLLTFSLLAFLALITIESSYLSYPIAGICFYIGLAGILLTIAGVKRTDLKEDIAIHIKKRGALV